MGFADGGVANYPKYVAPPKSIIRIAVAYINRLFNNRSIDDSIVPCNSVKFD